ncbi:MAG: phosphopantothenate/pantothenate synthetase [Thermoplasmatota archaeon]
MTRIPRTHPRYASLVVRERVVAGLERGLLAREGLLAHGRGEAFDYLLGERTWPEARAAARAAAALLLTARRPVLSVNGNVASLVPREMVRLARAVPGSVLEVNLFYRTEGRARRIARELRRAGASSVLGSSPDARLPGVSSCRAACAGEGMLSADVVLVPLEDGDRAGALRALGKKVIAVDLNPLSRTARAADVTIVDNVVRAVPELIRQVRSLRRLPRDRLARMAGKFDNERNLRTALRRIQNRLRVLSSPGGLPAAPPEPRRCGRRRGAPRDQPCPEPPGRAAGARRPPPPF